MEAITCSARLRREENQFQVQRTTLAIEGFYVAISNVFNVFNAVSSSSLILDSSEAAALPFKDDSPCKSCCSAISSDTG